MDPAPISPFRMADLRGLALLGADATRGIVDLVEHLHGTIAARVVPFGTPGRHRTSGITGAVYGTVRGVTRLVRRGLDRSLRLIEPAATHAAPSARREAVLAAINGLWGDHLAASGNPLAITMTLRVDGRAVELTSAGLRAALPTAGPRIAVLVHGLCMNDLQWRRQGHHHGEMLARDAGWTVLALHYDSGLPVEANGARFAALLDTLHAAWPVPVRELALVGHSMGGLVARSACRDAEQAGLVWRAALTRLVCLGTPHQGALLERGVHGLDMALALSPYAAPFARIGGARSAGIRDLREGGAAAPLPAGVAVGLLAATTTAQPRGLRHALIGDGLVTVASAWGEHRDPARALGVPASRKHLVTGANHWDLLSHPEAAAALRDWMA